MKKIFLISAIFAIFAVWILTQIARPVSARTILPLGRFKRIENGYPLDVYVDNETGVEYVVAENDDGIGISVIYNKDGSVRIRKDKK